jgi:DNA-binding NtrC family response regulator
LREDLYYRLSTVVLEVPPLRERREEIPLLLGHLIEKHGGRRGLPVRSLSDSAREFAECHGWPGNVRELENFAKRYLILGDPALADTESEVLLTSALKSVASTVKHDAEKSAIRSALDQTNWHRKEAAKLLEISYKTLLDKLHLYQLDKKNGDHTP